MSSVELTADGTQRAALASVMLKANLTQLARPIQLGMVLQAYAIANAITMQALQIAI